MEVRRDVVVDAGEDIGELGLRVDAAQLCAFYQGHRVGKGLATSVVAGEEPILATNSDRPHGALGGVVVEGHAPVLQETVERRPAVQGIAKGLGEVALARDVAQVVLGPELEGPNA